MREDVALLSDFFSKHGSGTSYEKAWERLLALLLKTKRISSNSLPAAGSAAQMLIMARDHLAEGIARLPPGADVDHHLEKSLTYLTSGIDALTQAFTSAPGEAPPPSDSVPPPPRR